MSTEKDDYAKLSQEMLARLGIATSADQTIVKKKFKQNILDIIKGPAEHSERTPENRAVREEEVRSLTQQYFTYRQAACRHGALSLKGQKDHAEALAIKSRAVSVLDSMQRAVIFIALGEMDFYDRILKAEADLAEIRGRLGGKHADVKWTFDLPEKIKAAIEKRKKLEEAVAGMKKINPLLEKLDPVYIVIKRLLTQLLKEGEGAKAYAEFESNYRNMRFTHAREAIQALHRKNKPKFYQKKKKIKTVKWGRVLDISNLMLRLMEEVGPLLQNPEGKLYVRYAEFSKVFQAAQKDLENVCAFLESHEISEVEYRYEALKREQTRLYEVASFSAYLDLYEGLQEGSEFPLSNLKELRSFETEYCKKAEVITRQGREQVDLIMARLGELSQSAFSSV